MDKEHLVLRGLLGGDFTANEIIEDIYKRDVRSGLFRTDWKFYNHINKRFAPLEKRGFIFTTGYKIGPTGKNEKIWSLRKTALENYVAVEDLAA